MSDLWVPGGGFDEFKTTNITRTIKIEIGDRFHIDEEDDETLFNANNFLVLKHYPNDYFNYEVIEFKDINMPVSVELSQKN